MNDTPRDAAGAKLCAWCGEPIRQSGVGRSKDYCRRSCRQRAYEQRQVEKQLVAHRRLWEHMASVSSRDETRIPEDSSRDETVPAGPAPVPVRAADSSPPEPVPPAPPAEPSRNEAAVPAQEALPLFVGMGFGFFAREQEADDGS